MATRRSLRLRSRIQATEEGLRSRIQASEEGGPRRSSRLRSRIQASEEGAPRRSPRLRSRIQATEDGARRTSSSPLEDVDLLWEILLRLSPQPSSLPRASAVCRRWRGLVTDPKFRSHFYAHHRKPPLLGFFHAGNQGIVFTPVLDPPDRIPPQRFHLGCCSSCNLLDCRHSLVLVQHISCRTEPELVVCDLITRVRRRIAIPTELWDGLLLGTMLCAAGDHLHSSGPSSPFKVVLVCMRKPDYQPFICLYSSSTGLWGDLISTQGPCQILYKHTVLVGSCLYWFCFYDEILELDLDENNLTVIKGPQVSQRIDHDNLQVIGAEDGALGFAVLSYPHFAMWRRKVVGHGAATWVRWKTIVMDTIIGLPSRVEVVGAYLLGYDEDTDALFLHADGNVYGVQLELMKSRKLYESQDFNRYQPFRSFITAGEGMAANFECRKMLLGT